MAMGLRPSAGDATQRCNPVNSFLAARRGSKRDWFGESGVLGFGYTLLGVTVASAAAAATATALVLVHPPPNQKWRLRFLDYWYYLPWSKARRSGDDASVEIAAALQRSSLQLGFSFLDTSCPPSNVVLDALHCFHDTRLPTSSSSPDRVCIICLTVNDGNSSQLPLSARRRGGRFLLVEMLSDGDNVRDRKDLLAMYEAVEGAVRGTSPAAALGEGKSRGSLLMGSLSRFVCPYFGLLRLRIGTPDTVSSWPQGTAENRDALRSLPACPGEREQEKMRLFLALGDPRDGMRSPCTLTIKIETRHAATPALAPPSQDRSSSMSFYFEGMRWEGTAADANLAGTPSVWGASLRVSLGEDWGRSLTPKDYGGVFARFFHDGVRLQAGRVVSAISQLRELAHLHKGRRDLYDTAREADHTDHLTAQNHQHRRRRSSSGGGRGRQSTEQRPKRQVPPKSDQSFPQMLPATILLTYDSWSSEPESPTRAYPVGREDGLNIALERSGSLAQDGSIQTPGRSRRRSSSSGTRVAGFQRRGGHDGVAVEEGGRSGMRIRVVEFQPDHNGRSQQEEDGVCLGLEQVVRFLETLLELSRKLPALSPVGRFCSRMRFAAAEGGLSTGGAGLASPEGGGLSPSYYRRRGSSRHGQNAPCAHLAAWPGETRGADEVAQGEDLSFSPSGSVGAHPLSSGAHGRGRRASYDVTRELSPGRQTSAAVMPSGTGRHRSSWSPGGSNGARFGWLVDRKRARSEENCSFSRRSTLPSASTTPAEGSTDPATAAASERWSLSEQLSRQRRSRGPSLPSVSCLMGVASHGCPGQGAQAFNEGRWGSTANRAAAIAQDGAMSGREGAKIPKFAEEKLEVTGAGSEEHKDGGAGWPRCETEDTSNDERGPSEVEILDDIANMTGRLPQMVRKTVDVDLLRGWRGEAGGRGSEEKKGPRDDDVMIGMLQGWKAAVDALDQSQRELQCYREMEGQASSAILGALEATMATFRGQVLVMTGKNAEWLACRAKRCRQNPQQAAKLFKEAHCAVKSVVVLAGGDGPSGARWRLSERQLVSIAKHHLTPLLENLRLLVVAFDNMREEDRNEISTVEEIVNNRDWLLRIATICTSAERQTLSRHSRTALPPRTADEGDSSRLLSTSAYLEMAADETPRENARRVRESRQQFLGRADSSSSGRCGGGGSFPSEGGGTRYSDARDGTKTRPRKEMATTAIAEAGVRTPSNIEQEEQKDESFSSCASSSMSSFATA